MFSNSAMQVASLEVINCDNTSNKQRLIAITILVSSSVWLKHIRSGRMRLLSAAKVNHLRSIIRITYAMLLAKPTKGVLRRPTEAH